MTIPNARLTPRQAYRQVAEEPAFGQVHVLGIDSRSYATVTAGGGTVTHVAAEAAYRTAVGTANGDRALLVSHARLRAAASGSRSVVIAGHISTPDDNRKLRWGAFDDNNGFFFELAGETLHAVRRTNVSGSVVETRVASAQWSQSKTLPDLTKTSVYEIREAWPSGDLWFFVNGTHMHTISTGGSVTGPETRHARLPVAVEAVNTGAASAGGSFSCVSLAVWVEAQARAQRSWSVQARNAAVGTSQTALVAIRPKTTLGGVSVYGELSARVLSIATGAETVVQIVAGASAAGAFASHDAESLAESSTAPGALTGGKVVAQFCVNGSREIDLAELFESVRLNGDGTQDTLAVTAAAITGTTTVSAALTWREIR